MTAGTSNFCDASVSAGPGTFKFGDTTVPAQPSRALPPITATPPSPTQDSKASSNDNGSPDNEQQDHTDVLGLSEDAADVPEDDDLLNFEKALGSAQSATIRFPMTMNCVLTQTTRLVNVVDLPMHQI